MAAPPKKYTTEWTQAPLPPTKRAYGIHLNYGILNEKNEKNESVKNEKICYGTGLLALVRDVQNPAKVAIFNGHQGKVNVVAPAPSGNWVASGDDTGVVHIWAFPQLTIKNTLRIGSGVNDIRWSADSAMVVAAGNGSTEFAKAFRFDAQNPLGKIDRMTKQCLSVDWSPIKPSRVALSDEDCSVLFYHGVPFKYDSRSTHHTRYPNVVRFSPDGKYFATVGSDSKIIIYDGQTGAKVKELTDADSANNHSGSIFGLAWHKDSLELVTASADKTVKIWNVEQSKCVHTWVSATNTATGNVDDQQCGVMWSPSEEPVSINLAGNIQFWSRSSTTPVKTILGHHSNILARVFSRATKTLYTADLEGRILVTDVETGAMSAFAGDGHSGKPINALAISADGKTLYSAGYDQTLQQHDVSAKAFGKILRPIPSNAKDIAVAADGTVFVALSNGSLISTKDGAEGKKLSFTNPIERLRLVDNKLYAFSNPDKKLRVLGLDLVELSNPETQYDSIPSDVAVTSAGRVFSAEGSQVIPWKEDLSGPQAFGWSWHTAQISAISLSPDQTKLASVGGDKAIVIWQDLETLKGGKNLLIKDIHPTGYVFVDWIDDSTVLTISQEGVILRNKLQF